MSLVHPLEVGAKCQALDANQKWWHVTILAVNADGTYRASVEDGAGCVWNTVDKMNTRMSPEMEEVLAKLQASLEQAEKAKNDVECDIAQKKIDRVQKGLPPEPTDDTKPAVAPPPPPPPPPAPTATLTHPIPEGTTCESIDAEGTWWKIVIKGVNADKTYRATVMDEERSQWDSVHPENIRPLQSKEATKEARIADTKADKEKDKEKGKKEKKDKKDKKEKKKEKKEKKKKKKRDSSSSSSSRSREKKKDGKDQAKDKDDKEKEKGKDDKPLAKSNGKKAEERSSTGNPLADPSRPLEANDLLWVPGEGMAVVTNPKGQDGNPLVRLPKGPQELAVSRGTRVTNNWIEVPGVGTEYRDDGTKMERKAQAIHLERTETGDPKGPNVTILQPRILHGGCHLWTVSLLSYYNEKKSDVPSQSIQPGPFAFGVVDAAKAKMWQQASMDVATISNFSDCAYYTSPSPIANVAANQQQPCAFVVDPEKRTTQQMPLLLKGHKLYIAINRVHNTVTWAVDGFIAVSSYSLPRNAQMCAFISLCRGHKVQVDPPLSPPPTCPLALPREFESFMDLPPAYQRELGSFFSYLLRAAATNTLPFEASKLWVQYASTVRQAAIAASAALLAVVTQLTSKAVTSSCCVVQ